MLALQLALGLLVLLVVSALPRRTGSANANEIEEFTIQMIGYSPTKSDDYVAVSVKAVEGYIVGFEPMANADRVHHMLLYGCSEPYGQDSFWVGMGTCGRGSSHILYAWARNAPNLALPRDVGFSLGHDEDSIKYLVLQVHYAQPFAGNVKDFSGVTLHVTQKPPLNLAAVLLFVSGESIPPHESQHQNNVSCEYPGNTELHPFAFRTHTHAMGRVVSAFFKHEGHWNKIGIRNPQWPQLFESITSSPVIRKGDLMSATCRFDSSDKNEPTAMGAMGSNEMCNFYMMFYWNAKEENPFPYGAVCGSQERMNEMVREYPKEGTELLPSHPELEHHAHQSSVPFGIIEEGQFSEFDGVPLGQVSGAAFDNDGNVIVFHRASRSWGPRTFDQYNYLLDKTPIDEDVILFVDFNDNKTKVVKKLGKGQFYLPHGIYMDKENFLYTTDVGSHTVAKWRINGNNLEKIWEHGEKLKPDSDRTHFCKPAGIVRSGDHIYVADGYCNSRIVELDLNGNRTNEFGLPGDGPVQFMLPHDIVTDSKGNLIVTDRENGRVQVLSRKGDFITKTSSTLFSNIYSADVFQDMIFMVPGRRSESHVNEAERDIEVFAGRSGTGLVEFSFAPTSSSFGTPHVLRICPNGEHIFIGDIARSQGGALWKFRVQREGATGSMMVNQQFTSYVSMPSSSSPSFLLFLAAAVGICAWLFWKKFLRKQPNGVFDRKGFKPLRTDETVGFISDGSDSE